MRVSKIWFVIFVSFSFVGFYNLFLTSAENGAPAIHYVLSVDDPHAPFFNVTIAFENPGRARLIFRMPRWSPGAYRIRNYADNVVAFAAHNRAGKKLNVQKVSEDGWQVVPSGDFLEVSYQVEPAYETWSQTALDTNYALVEGPSVFMYLDGKTHLPATVEYRVPQNWGVASPLKPLPTPNHFYADNYDVLADSPAQLGNFDRRQFQINGVPIELVFHGAAEFAVDSFLVMTQKICAYQIEFFNEIPFERYVFFYRIFPGRASGGGLEHANSTTIGLSGERLSANVLSAAEVTAHEFFHVWNVKRIRPKILEAIDYTTEERTNALWFAEGVTSYYEALTLVRTQLWSEAEFLDEMERQIEGLQQTSDRRATSVEEVSRTIWERGYLHSGVSFYNKGELLGLLLDLYMRQATGNRVSLDDVMRFKNWWFAKENVGFEESDIERAVSSLAQHDFSGFFADYVSGTQELPFAEALSFAGYEVALSSEWAASLGEVLFVGPHNRIIYLDEDSPLFAAGVRKNDYLLQVAEVDVATRSQLLELVRQFEIGAELPVKIWREGEEAFFTVKVGKKEWAECEIAPMAAPTDLQLAIRRGWLTGDRD